MAALEESPTKKPIRLALIGAGMAGTVLHLSMLLKNPKAEVVCICDVSSEKISDFKKNNPALKIETRTDPESVFSDQSIDAVLIATPTDTHVELSIRAVESGKHVFCEKPISNNLSTAQRLVDAAEKHAAQRIVMIGHVLRYWPDYVEIKKIIERGEIGDPVIARAYRANPMPASEFYEKEELSGGVIIDLALHDIDFLAWALGPIESVFAQGGNFSGRGGSALVDYAQIHFNFVSGAIGYIETNWALPATYPFSTAFEVTGREGMISVDNSEARSSLEIVRRGEQRSFESVSDLNGYYHEQDAFFDAIAAGQPSPIPPRDAMYAMILATAAKESIRANRPIRPEEIDVHNLSVPSRGAQ